MRDPTPQAHPLDGVDRMPHRGGQLVYRVDGAPHRPISGLCRLSLTEPDREPEA